jgi:hypothetical protein
VNPPFYFSLFSDISSRLPSGFPLVLAFPAGLPYHAGMEPERLQSSESFGRRETTVEKTMDG